MNSNNEKSKLLQALLKMKPFAKSPHFSYLYFSQIAKNTCFKSLKQAFQCEIMSFKLTITNTSSDKIQFNHVFPCIKHELQNPHFQYIFPEQPLRLSDSCTKYKANYGGRMHFPFTSLKAAERQATSYKEKIKTEDQQEFLMFLVNDQKGMFKQLTFQKTSQGNLYFKVAYYNISLGPKQSMDFPEIFVIFAKNIQKTLNFLPYTIEIYKQISSRIRHQINKQLNINQKSSFNTSFLLRVLQFYQIQWHQNHRRIKNLAYQSILQLIQQDQQLVGPINMVHLRDWSAEGDGLATKFGNYIKQQKLTGGKITKQWLKKEIRILKQNGVDVGLYVQGYILSKKLFQNQKQQIEKMQMLDKQPKPYTIWGSSNYTLCNFDIKWRQLLVSSIISICDFFENAGIYIDQFGFGSRTSPYKVCTHSQHSHSAQQFDLQVGQLNTLKLLSQSRLKSNLKVYIEQTPNDIAMRQIAGSLSSGAKLAASRPSDEIPLLLTRFIFPEHKVYELISQYCFSSSDMLSNNKTIEQDISKIIKGIAIAFWNGNGIYLPKNLQFYHKYVLILIKKLNECYLAHKQYFSSNKCEPLCFGQIKNGVNQVLGNKFYSSKNNVQKQSNEDMIITLLNLSQAKQQLSYCQQTITMNGLSVGILKANNGILKQINLEQNLILIQFSSLLS